MTPAGQPSSTTATATAADHNTTYPTVVHEPFALLQDSLLFLPSPNSGHVKAYRSLFQKVHADKDFCFTAFGDSFPPRNWTDDEVKAALLERDALLRWGVRGMGDFAIGYIPDQHMSSFTAAAGRSRVLKSTEQTVHVIEGQEFQLLLGGSTGAAILEDVAWAGYACVRDATTTCLKDLYLSATTEELHSLPAWPDMIELRYGLDASFRGKGVITKAMKICMSWAVEERGARRFIAEVQKHNSMSSSVLARLGLQKTDTNYFQDDAVEEWMTI